MARALRITDLPPAMQEQARAQLESTTPAKKARPRKRVERHGPWEQDSDGYMCQCCRMHVSFRYWDNWHNGEWRKA